MNLSKFMPFEGTAEELEAEICRVRDEIVRRVHPVRIYLFGSAVEGRVHSGSDLDLSVIVESEAQVKGAKDSLYARPPLSEMPIDLLVYGQDRFLENAATGGVCQIILEDGKILYDRVNGTIE